MQIREYSLPVGWYPRDPQEISRFLEPFNKKADKVSCAAVSPHAGWYYSGRVAAKGVASLEGDVETVVVLGGHLSSSSSPLFAMEDAVRTPFGLLPVDNDLREVLLKELDGKEDRFRDNTVEVLLPMVHYFFPKAKLLWIRLPAAMASYEAGKIIFATAEKLGIKLNVLGSTDLTHYGLNYGFTSKGTGAAAIKWVREVNDANFIKAVESGESGEVLLRAEADRAACSAGAVLGAMGFAKAKGFEGARLIEYATSADVQNDNNADSFVGYAAFSFY